MSRRAGIGILVATGLLTVAVSCGYIALPFGLTVNFPGFSGDPMPDQELRQRVKVPAGFSIGTYATGIENARILRFTSSGDLLVSASRQGKVFLLARDANGDGVADGQRVLLDHLYQPHGMVLHDGWLYVAETTGVLRVRFDEASGTLHGTPEHIIQGLPDGGNHWTRTIDVGPDGQLYVSVGSSCNVCEGDDRRRAAILRYHLDGSGEQLYATGLRNSVDFDWQPGSNELYATDNGRDLLGDDFPPDEFNRIVEGGFYGWPYANGDRVPDPDFGKGHAAQIAASIPPAHAFGAHVASLGMTFYRPPAGNAAASFPARYQGAAFVAQHGSWNRSKKSGYQVVALFFEPDGTITEEPFVTGFMIDEQVYGRPVDPAVGPDGALYVSDDFTGSVYRVAYGEQARAGAAPAGQPTSAVDPLAGLAAQERNAAEQRGAALWTANQCAVCHDRARAAPNAYHALEHLGGRYTIESLIAFLRTPQPPMPVPALDDAQRREVAIYLLQAHP